MYIEDFQSAGHPLCAMLLILLLLIAVAFIQTRPTPRDVVAWPDSALHHPTLATEITPEHST